MEVDLIERKRMVLRVAYGAAAVAVAVIGVVVMNMLKAIFAATPQAGALVVPFSIFMVIVILAMAGVFVFLAWRPYWWGKLLVAMAAVSWLMNGAVSFLIATMIDPASGDAGIIAAFVATRPWVISCGLVMLAVVITLQITDPRFSGSWFGRPPAA
ncbi:MAG: hypothetical protein JWP35_3342 [Caulobacter sp.]|nr:hypothetical protein [Caulobacter sp.]